MCEISKIFLRIKRIKILKIKKNVCGSVKSELKSKDPPYLDLNKIKLKTKKLIKIFRVRDKTLNLY